MGEAKKEEQARQELVDLGASTTKTARGTIYTLTIIGQIEGHQVLYALRDFLIKQVRSLLEHITQNRRKERKL